jgi:hypothetical protein
MIRAWPAFGGMCRRRLKNDQGRVPGWKPLGRRRGIRLDPRFGVWRQRLGTEVGEMGLAVNLTARAAASIRPHADCALPGGRGRRLGDRPPGDSAPAYDAPRCGFSGRRQPLEEAPAEALQRAGSGRFTALFDALFDCKFATVNQLFGGDAVAEPNSSGIRLRFMDKVAASASAESGKAVAGACRFDIVCPGVKIDVSCVGINARTEVRRRQGGTAGVGDVLNEARARW